MAILIDFEGPDCCFKSSIIDQLKEMMRADEYLSNFEIFSFDNIIYDDPNAYYIKNYLNGKYGDPSELNNTLKMHLQAMSRIDNIIDAGEIFNNDQNIILLDRYTLSNMIYNSKIYSSGLEMTSKYLDELNKIINFEHSELGIHTPDFVVLLQQDQTIAKNILKKRKAKQDKLESNDYFMDNIYKKYYDPTSVYYINLEDLYNYKEEMYDTESNEYEFINRMIFRFEERYDKDKKLTYPEYYCLYLATLNKSPMFFNKYYCYETINNEEVKPLDLNTICNCILPDIKNIVAYKTAILLSKKVQTNNMEVF